MKTELTRKEVLHLNFKRRLLTCQKKGHLHLVSTRCFGPKNQACGDSSYN